MSCPHSRIGTPDRCSQCLGVVPRRVSNDGPAVTVDGERTDRALDRSDELAKYYARRGGRVKRHGGAL